MSVAPPPSTRWPAGSGSATLCLRSGWRFDGADVRGPELMVNHLLRLAERTLA